MAHRVWGKTYTLTYLVGRMPGRTVILTTGRGMGLVQTVAQMARTLAPTMVVLEDVNLIAEQRGEPMMPSGPLLFELLNEMDGLRDDADVIFVLTTNRPDLLEPALAARPGRIDLVLELPLPDVVGRRRLLDLYARGLDLVGVDLDALTERTDGASPACIKELLRKAALLAALEDSGVVYSRHVDAAARGAERRRRACATHPEPVPPPRASYRTTHPPGATLSTKCLSASGDSPRCSGRIIWSAPERSNRVLASQVPSRSASGPEPGISGGAEAALTASEARRFTERFHPLASVPRS